MKKNKVENKTNKIKQEIELVVAYYEKELKDLTASLRKTTREYITALEQTKIESLQREFYLKE